MTMYIADTLRETGANHAICGSFDLARHDYFVRVYGTHNETKGWRKLTVVADSDGQRIKGHYVNQLHPGASVFLKTGDWHLQVVSATSGKWWQFYLGKVRGFIFNDAGLAKDDEQQAAKRDHFILLQSVAGRTSYERQAKLAGGPDPAPGFYLTLEEAKAWIEEHPESGGSTLMRAAMEIMSREGFERQIPYVL